MTKYKLFLKAKPMAYEKDYVIGLVENFYCDRISKLVEDEKYEYSEAIFKEFVVDGEEPEEWLFVNFMEE